MGTCGSILGTSPLGKQRILTQIDGGEQEYHQRFLEDPVVLGQGEFGIVRLVYDTQTGTMPQQQQQQQQRPPCSSIPNPTKGMIRQGCDPSDRTLISSNPTATTTRKGTLGVPTRTAPSHSSMTTYACKMLRKGMVFKDNVLYSPLKPEVLRGEVEILRTLQGEFFCLRLVAVYETPRVLYMVTEYCAGGEMMEYVSQQRHDWTTIDVSRIAWQLLSAVRHCAQYGVIHRDIKPENIMFQDPQPKSSIRLIDFGSGTMSDRNVERTSHAKDDDNNNDDPNDTKSPQRHSTMAGTAFYTSPELFQRSYTQRTDVWSVGVVLYVLVAGYPAEVLQRAFNILQSSTVRDLRRLPNMPQDGLPDEYFDVLQACLTYDDRKRPTAQDLLQYEFVQYHIRQQEQQQEQQELPFQQHHESSNEFRATLSSSNLLLVDEDEMDENHTTTTTTTTTTSIGNHWLATHPLDNDTAIPTRTRPSVSLQESVLRHTVVLGWKQHERSITTLLATLLNKQERERLVEILQSRMVLQEGSGTFSSKDMIRDSAARTGPVEENKDSNNNTKNAPMNLHIIPMFELKSIIRDHLRNDLVLTAMSKLPDSDHYDHFAYHISLIFDFTRPNHNNNNHTNTVSRSGSVRSDHGDSRRGKIQFQSVRVGSKLKSVGSTNSLHTLSFIRR